MLSAEYFDPIVAFLREIGLPVQVGPFGAEGFLPGVTIMDGALRVDPDHLYVSGDLLHEAGHMTIVPARLRAQLGNNLEESLRERLEGQDDPLARLALQHTEMMAIAWSYAALRALNLPPEVIFFAGGYRLGPEQQQQFVAMLDSGNYFGIAHLARAGMTGPCGIMALLQQNGLPPYPQMTKWLQD
ncbi:hypothetical protein [Niveispirillum sp. BGYR6]|uniref:hypothetical protein n=1 Tax=Niveispirillum sp. BGYR6 TaxID=2971249 RepID=UPI0022B9CA6D|nr:hypothetical protein [Niveispirillum sp. BGYR6]MDG5497137.1 hypothetical protein [Niveispirillum sp. BGYR6]